MYMCVCSSLFVTEQICSTNALHISGPSLPVKVGNCHLAQHPNRSSDLHEIRKWIPFSPLFGSAIKGFNVSHNLSHAICVRLLSSACANLTSLWVIFLLPAVESSEVRLEHKFAIRDAMTTHYYPSELTWITCSYKPLHSLSNMHS